MVADRPISVLHHMEKDYRPNKAGEFTIEDHHVDGVRPHGLMLKEEAEAKKKPKPAEIGALVAENTALKARVAELEAAAAKK
jgi:hypothetical protein